MNKKTKILFIMLCAGALNLLCKQNNPTCPYQPNSMSSMNLFIKHNFIHTKQNPSCCYSFEMKYWADNFSTLRYQPKVILAGNLCERNDSIFFCHPQSNTFQYIVDDYSSLRLKKNPQLEFLFTHYNILTETDSIIAKEYYTVCVEKKIVGPNKVYKVRVFNYAYFSFYRNNNDLVFFYDPTMGIQGAYLCWNRSFGSPNAQDSIFSHIGNIYNEREKYWFEPLGSYE